MDLLSERQKDLLKMCCVCGKIYLSMNGHSRWVGKEHPMYEAMYEDLMLIYREEKDITHDKYCDVCEKNPGLKKLEQKVSAL